MLTEQQKRNIAVYMIGRPTPTAEQLAESKEFFANLQAVSEEERNEIVDSIPFA